MNTIKDPCFISSAPPFCKLNFNSDADFADTVAQTAVKSLLYEVSTTPKPGLVDKANSGAHHDMDFLTFIDSSLCLLPYFKNITLAGCSFSGSANTMLPNIRHLGINAEKDMLAATGGVNTHKGLIFSLGILCASLGHMRRCGISATAKNLAEHAALVCTGLCAELHELTEQKTAVAPLAPAAQDTYGLNAYTNHGVTGIRGEMQNGLPAVMQCGLPALRGWLQKGAGLNTAGVAALLQLMAVVEDTNIIGRAGKSQLQNVQEQILNAMNKEPDEAAIYALANRLDKEFIAKNISPGGSADLLAISFFMLFWVG